MRIREIKTQNKHISNAALPSDSAAEFSLYLRRAEGVWDIKLCICKVDGTSDVYPLKWRESCRGEERWSVHLPPLSAGLYYYHYEVYSPCGKTCYGGEEEDVLTEDSGRQLLVYDSSFKVPERMKGSVIYHIFVDRFFKGSGPVSIKEGSVTNDDWYGAIPQFGEYPGAEVKNNEFFGGNLWGIAEKLDYIKSLGTDYIYLSPVFDASSNHKYDTGDYLTVDEMFGGDSALSELITKAKKMGIGIILDGVFNHTGDDSIYFNRRGTYPGVGACDSEKSKYFDWYTFSSWPDSYDCWWGVKILPRVDSSNPSYKSFIYDQVVRKWMAMGIAGWRLDVADELSDDFLYGFRRAVKKYNDEAFIIGEVWEDASNKIAYGKHRNYLQGFQLDSVMNYPFRDAVISYIKSGDYAKLIRTVGGICRRYPADVLNSLMNFLGTHDTERIITVLGGESAEGHTMRELSRMKMTAEEYSSAVRRVICAYYLIGFLPGMLSVYYGDEIGMEGYRDPFCRRPFPWGKENKEILSAVKKITSIRKNESVFRDGQLTFVEVNTDFAILKRSDNRESVICAVNRSEFPLKISIDADFRVLGDKKETTARSITVMPSDGVYMKVCSPAGEDGEITWRLLRA